LSVERVHDVSSGFNERSFEHVRKEREYAVERLELFVGFDASVLNSSEELGEDGKVENERRG